MVIVIESMRNRILNEDRGLRSRAGETHPIEYFTKRQTSCFS